MNKKISVLFSSLLLVSNFASAATSVKSADIPRSTMPANQGNPTSPTHESVQKENITETLPNNTSTATAEKTTAQKILSHFKAGFFSIYHGGPLNDLGSRYVLNNKGEKAKGLSQVFDSDMSLSYSLTENLGIGPVVPFLIAPVPGQHFIIGDVGGRIFDRKTISTEHFNLYTNLIFQAPTSDSSKERGMDLGIKTTPNFRYLFPHSNFRMGAWTEAKAYLGVTKGKTFKLWAGPYLSYSFSDSFALSVLYEMEAHHLLGKPTFDFTNYQTDLQPGVVWNITSHLMINPYIQVFTGNKVSFENSGVGAVISATLL